MDARLRNPQLSVDTTSPTLPLELWYDIIDYLRDDLPALAACSLTCRSWHPTARLRLFHTIVLKDISTYMCFWRHLDEFPDIAPCVRDLTIFTSPSLAVAAAHTSLDPIMPKMLSQLHNVEVLTLGHWRAIHMSEDTRRDLHGFFPSLRVLNLVACRFFAGDFIRVLSACPRLTALHTTRVALDPPFLEGPSLRAIIRASPRSVGRRPIDTLTLFNDPQPGMPANLSMWEQPFALHLRTLEAWWDSTESVTILGLSLGDLIEAAGPTLEHLNLAIRSTFVPPGGDLSVGRCTNLRSLTLTDVNIRGRCAANWIRAFLALIQPAHASLRQLEVGLILAGPSDVQLLPGWDRLDEELMGAIRGRRELVVTLRLRPMRPPCDLDAWTRDTADEVVKRLPSVRAGCAWLRVLGAPYRFELEPPYGGASSEDGVLEAGEREHWFRC